MFGKKPEEKQIADTAEEKARLVTSVRFLDSHIINTGLQFYVLYSLVVTYRDMHCELLELKADDPFLKAILPKLADL